MTVGLSDPHDSFPNVQYHYSYATSVTALAATYAEATDGTAKSFTFDISGVYTLYGRIFDSAGGSTTYQTTVDVTDGYPVLSSPGNQTASTGIPLPLTVSFTDPSTTQETYSYQINWGDNSESSQGTVTPEESTSSSGVRGSIVENHIYTQDGTYLVTVSVTDGHTDTSGNLIWSSCSFSVDAKATRPVVWLGGPADVSEGTTWTASGGFAELDGSSFSGSVDFGDGTPPQSVPLSSTQTFQLTHAYVSPGTYHPIVSITDSSGGVGTASMTVVVSGAAPQITLEPTTSATTGCVFTSQGSFLDHGQGPWTGSVDYGDGSPECSLILNTDGTFSLNHVYSKKGSYRVHVSIADGNNAVGTGTQLVSVELPTPHVQLGSDQTIVKGETFTCQGSFNEPGATSWTALVNYGDGTLPQPLALNSDHSFVLNHVYAVSGDYTVTVSITDAYSSVGAGHLHVTVNKTPPQVTVTGDSQVAQGSRYLLRLLAADSNQPAVVNWTIDWNDGTAVQDNSGADVTTSHYFNQAGTFTVRVTATDANHTAVQRTLTVAVLAPQPTLVVSDGNTNIANGTGTVALVNAIQGMPVTHTFTIANTGPGTLTLIPSSLVLPTGWTLGGAFPTAVAPYQEASLVVQVATASVGTYSGQIAFQANDEHSPTFQFTVSGEVVADTGLVRIEGFSLRHDPHLPGADPAVHATYDPRVTGVVRGDFTGQTVQVEAECSRPGGPTTTCVVDVPASTRSFTYDPRQMDPDLAEYTGAVLLRYRLVLTDANANPSPGEWSTFLMDLKGDPEAGHIRVDALVPKTLPNGSGTTPNPALVGVVAGDFGGNTVWIQFDHDADGQADGWIDLTSPGQSFVYDPRNWDDAFVGRTGATTLLYRLVPLDGQGQPVGSPVWTSFTYSLSELPPTTYVLALSSKEATTSSSTIGGTVTNIGGTPVTGAAVQLRLSTDAGIDVTVLTDGDGRFTWRPDDLPYNQLCTIQARTVESRCGSWHGYPGRMVLNLVHVATASRHRTETHERRD